jgi:hypothetical protein
VEISGATELAARTGPRPGPAGTRRPFPRAERGQEAHDLVMGGLPDERRVVHLVGGVSPEQVRLVERRRNLPVFRRRQPFDEEVLDDRDLNRTVRGRDRGRAVGVAGVPVPHDVDREPPLRVGPEPPLIVKLPSGEGRPNRGPVRSNIDVVGDVPPGCTPRSPSPRRRSLRTRSPSRASHRTRGCVRGASASLGGHVRPRRRSSSLSRDPSGGAEPGPREDPVLLGRSGGLLPIGYGRGARLESGEVDPDSPRRASPGDAPADLSVPVARPDDSHASAEEVLERSIGKYPPGSPAVGRSGRDNARLFEPTQLRHHLDDLRPRHFRDSVGGQRLAGVGQGAERRRPRLASEERDDAGVNLRGHGIKKRANQTRRVSISDTITVGGPSPVHSAFAR